MMVLQPQFESIVLNKLLMVGWRKDLQTLSCHRRLSVYIYFFNNPTRPFLEYDYWCNDYGHKVAD